MENIPLDATRDHRFCIAIEITNGWVASIGILSVDDKVVEVPLEYDNLPGHCQKCSSQAHTPEQCVVKPTLDATMQQLEVPILEQ